jgi:benzylsuccinate CoA-transferase BbsE subunit
MYEDTASLVGDAPLAGMTVLDLTADLGAYAGRILGDLGASVTRVEPPGGLATRSAGHLVASGISAEYLFPNLSKRIIEADTTAPAGAAFLEDLLGTADVVITADAPSALRQKNLHPDDLSSRHPHLTHLSISPWGLTGPDCDRPATDLTLLAAGGLLSLAGDPDGPPVRPFGEQSSVAASLHGVVGLLIALTDSAPASARPTLGQLIDVSAHEAVTHSLENAAQFVDLEGVVRRRTGSRSSEAGTGLFACMDGHVYLVTGLGGLPLAWDGLIRWLDETGSSGVAHELAHPKWQDQQWRRTTAAAEEFRSLFGAHAAERTKVELYEQGQRFGVSISPVSTPEDLLANDQLNARNFFRLVEVDNVSVLVPGAPYRTSTFEIGPKPPRLVDGQDLARLSDLTGGCHG